MPKVGKFTINFNMNDNRMEDWGIYKKSPSKSLI